MAMTKKDETSIVPQNGTAGALAPRAEPDEMDVFGQARPDELILPIRKLVQGVSRAADSKRAGEFWDSLTDAYKPQLRVAILALSRSRSLFAEGSFDQAPVCASEDAIRPRQPIVTPDGEATGPTCNECPFSEWGTARDGKGKGQACRFSYNLLCWDLDDQAVFILRISGTSINPWRRYMTEGKLSNAPAYALETVISSDEQQFVAGKAYVLAFAHGDKLPPQMAASMREQAAAYRGISLGVESVVEEAEGPVGESVFD